MKILMAVTLLVCALAAAGWEHMISAKPLPPGADPGDLRYPTLRWATMATASLNGVTSYVVTYGVGDDLERGAAGALMGDQKITGRTPVSLPGFFKAGDGLQH